VDRKVTESTIVQQTLERPSSGVVYVGNVDIIVEPVENQNFKKQKKKTEEQILAARKS